MSVRSFLQILRILGILLLPCLLAGLAGCSSTPSVPVREGTASATATVPLHDGNLSDFSGNWEKNYQLSDDFNTKFQLYVADIQRRYSRGNIEATGLAPMAGANGEAITGLARFAEQLTRMPILDITQNNEGIIIEREDDFALRCRYEDKLYVRSSNAFGNDLCGWDKQQLVFNMQLGGGLQISHQFTLSPTGAEMNVMTTVVSDLVAAPIVISNYYTRYTDNERQYDCELTLTRQRVCTQQGRAP